MLVSPSSFFLPVVDPLLSHPDLSCSVSEKLGVHASVIELFAFWLVVVFNQWMFGPEIRG